MTSKRLKFSSDLLLVGGGLQNALIALAALAEDPYRSLTIVEKEARLGGNHTWCFHEADVPECALGLVEPLVETRWSGYSVHFPGMTRRLQQSYAAVTSDRLHRVVCRVIERSPNAQIVRGEVDTVTASTVQLVNGDVLKGSLVVDARGPERSEPAKGERYQKFVGLELEVEAGTLPAEPVLMDATVPQLDGYRFVYVLPFSPSRVLIEDTYYSDTPALLRSEIATRVRAYATSRGIQVRRVLRTEHGVLPLPTRRLTVPKTSSPLIGGYAGGFCHPTTGYSFPAAIKLALHLATRSGGSAFDSAYDSLVREHRRQARYALWLNRLLFDAFAPEERFHVLQRFYRLPEDTIRRFYAMNTTLGDRARIVCGRPPHGFSLRHLLSQQPPPRKLLA